MTSKQRAKLRSLANGLDTIFQIGKDGITDGVVSACNEALAAHELIKVRALETTFTPVKELALILAEKTDSIVVSTIGSKIILYKENPENKKIEL